METCPECHQQSTVYCVGTCKSSFCAAHDSEIHAIPSFSKHDRIEIERYKILQSAFCSKDLTQEERILHDKKCAVVEVELSSPEYRRIRITPEFSEATSGLIQGSFPSFISTLGPTGVGKSTLLRFLLQSFPAATTNLQLPISGNSDSATSTSSDIHLYGPVQIKEDPIFFFDSEGLGGSTVPTTILARLNALSKQLTERWSDATIRREIVETAYPKLLYLFSDIVCFVLQSNMKEKGFLLKLCQWANAATTRIVNQSIKPKLFIIFNKVEPSDYPCFQYLENNCDRWKDELKTEFFRGEEESLTELLNYFSDPVVYAIPHAGNHLKKTNHVIEIIQRDMILSLRVIRNERLRINSLFTAFNFRRCFRAAVQSINENKPFDLNVALRFYDRNKIGEALFLLFRSLYYENQNHEEETINIMNSIASFLPLIDAVNTNKQMRCGPGSSLPQQWCEIFRYVQQQCESDLFFCSATKEFPSIKGGNVKARCHCIRSTHQAEHQAPETYWRQLTFIERLQSLFLTSELECPCRWKGSFQENPKLKLDLITAATNRLAELDKWDEEKIFNQHKNLLRKFQGHLAGICDESICYSCLVTKDIQKLDCKHSFCSRCCLSMKIHNDFKCLICDKRNNIPDLTRAGYRILCLDAGGVFAIAQLAIIEQIELRLMMPITSFFDLIVASSTTAIAATLLCSEESCRVSDIRDSFTTALKEAYKPTIAIRKLILGSHYYNGNLFNWLDDTFPDTLIRGFSKKKIKLAIPALYNGEPVLFTSYEPKMESTHLPEISSIMLNDALKSAVSNPPYFPHHLYMGGNARGGELIFANPSQIALKEVGREKLDTIDCLLSLGTTKSLQHSLAWTSSHFNTLVENANQTAMEVSRQLPMDRKFFRFIANVPEKLDIDSVDSIDKIYAVVKEDLARPANQQYLATICEKLLSLLFVFDAIESRNDVIDIVIKSREEIVKSFLVNSLQIIIPELQIDYRQPINFSDRYCETHFQFQNIQESQKYTVYGFIEVTIEASEAKILQISGSPQIIFQRRSPRPNEK